VLQCVAVVQKVYKRTKESSNSGSRSSVECLCVVLQCIVDCCSVLQCVALCCSALQCVVAVCCRTFRNVRRDRLMVVVGAVWSVYA